MSLSDIKETLYKKDFDKNIQKFSGGVKEGAESQITSENSQKIAPEKWSEEKPKLGKDQKKAVMIGIIIMIIFVLPALAFVGYYEFRKLSFSEDKINLSIEGPEEADSGKLLSYRINIENLNRASLKNASLRLIYPENFKPETGGKFREEGDTRSIMDLGEIGSDGKMEALFSGRSYSPKGALFYLKAELVYTPSNSSSEFTLSRQVGVSIISFPVILEILGPQNAASGDSVDYLVKYKNEGNESFDDIRIRVEYPEGFYFSEANPKASESNNIWYIGRISPNQEGQIVISGKLEGSRGQIRVARAYVGHSSNGEFISFNDEKTETKMEASPLSVTQTVNGLTSLNANAGESLNFKINFKNESELGLHGVILTEKIDSPILDYKSLSLKKGSFDTTSKMITWKASDLPELNYLGPGQSSSIQFSIKIKSVIPIESGNDKNFVISSVAKIDSPDIPTPIQMNKVIAGNRIDIKLNSKLVLGTKGFYNDANVANSGPIPPLVGQKTTYTLHWLVSNVSNDVSGAKVEATLPSGVKMTGKIFPEDGRLTYNERSNSLVWEIGNLPAGTGILNAPAEISFQVEVIPAPNQVGKELDLCSQAQLSGKDSFTDQILSAVSPKKTTAIREDEKLDNTSYKVKAGN